MTLPAMPSNPPYREALRIGGGYGSSAAGQSPAGGLDIDNAGRLATDGDITCSGVLLADGDFAISGRNLEWSPFLGAEALRSNLSIVVKSFYPARVYLPCLPCPANVDTSIGAWVSLPPSYPGGALRFSISWSADTAPTPGNEDVQWAFNAAVFDDGDSLAVNAASIGMLDTYQGSTNLLHTIAGNLTPTNAGGGRYLSVLLRRLGTLGADTFDQTALLLGVRLEIA